MSMKKNVDKPDRIIRFCAAGALIIASMLMLCVIRGVQNVLAI